MPSRSTRVLVRVSAVIGVLACAGVFVAGMLSEPPRTAAERSRDEFQQVMDDAFRALRDGRVEDAIALATRATELRPKSDDAWDRLATAVHRSGDYQRALELHRRVARSARHQTRGLYNTACALAQLGRHDEAIETLGLAFQAGYYDANHAARDPDLEPVRADARFQRVIAKMRGVDPALFFWLGEWDVYDAASGSLAGSNTLTLENNALFIVERWRDSRGGSGQSFNYFDPRLKRWKQTWADANGVIEFIGAAHDEGGVIFEGDLLTAGAGDPPRMRMHVRPVERGFVRQTGSRWDAQTESWQPRYDLIYVPRGEPYPPEPDTEAPAEN